MTVQCVWTKRQLCLLVLATIAAMVADVATLSGPNVCMVKQKYNITKRIKYRAPMSVRTYEWCFSMPPRCSRWNTEMRDLTRLETEERTAEVSVCCPGYKMKDVSCVPICPNGKTGRGCTEDCKPNRWGPNCVHECKDCSQRGSCSPVTGECICQEGWQGESCEMIFTTSTILTTTEEELLLTTSRATTKTTVSSITILPLLTTPMSIPTTASTTTSTSASTASTITFQPTIPEITTMPNLMTKLPVKFQSNDNQTAVMKKITQTDKKLLNTTEKSMVANRSTYLTEMTTVTVPTQPELKTTISTSTVTSTTVKKEIISTKKVASTEVPVPNINLNIKETANKATPKLESTKKPETTVRTYPTTTLKFKPKEIWIKPAQKGESPIVETKTKAYNNLTPIKHKNATKIELIPITTPKTIIVSIIPTSVSYASFKKIALTTALYMIPKNGGVAPSNNKATDDFTKPMYAQTVTNPPFTKSVHKGDPRNITAATISPISSTPQTTLATTLATTRKLSTTELLFVNNSTNSMSRTPNAVTQKAPYPNSLTTVTFSFTNVTLNSSGDSLTENTTLKSISASILKKTSPLTTTVRPTKPTTSKEIDLTKQNTTMTKSNNAVESPNIPRSKNMTNDTKTTFMYVSETNNNNNITTTYKPIEDEEKFHILTEPEHITAVMSDKETDGSSVDLVSVISIAGGVMMAVITVAVIIVMMERCRRPRYEDVRKINDIRMQVMIDNNDVPPPYVRSIFHTPLPDPPTSEKCHYQPISTLDRNLKQFMRPVVVQTISPIMLENFRGILECHYDHLPAVPRRSHDFATLPARSMAPSMDAREHLLQRASLTNSAIEAMKREAKLDVIDTTTSEPLYAEIPCWRPPSEHAIEIINVNGEAVTEL